MSQVKDMVKVETASSNVDLHDSENGEVTNVNIYSIPSRVELKKVDQAYQYALETEGLQLDPVKEKKLVKKIDWYVLPLMCCLMSCQLMDKSTNSYASIVGLLEDLNMTTREYSWVATSFYLGYLCFEYPANMLLQRFPLSKTLALAVIAWGIVICCHGATKSSATFLLCRTLLGVFQSFMDTSYMLITCQYYKVSEQYMRCAFWLGMQGFGTLLGSGIAYGFYTHQDSYNIAPWRLLYVVTGVITIVFGLVSIIHLPDIPTKAWFFNEEEKKYVIERVRENRTGFGNQKYKPSQLKEALMDPTIYLFFLYMFGYGISNGALGNFGSILLEGQFGFKTGPALLMNMVGSGMDIIFPIAFAYLNQKLIPSRLFVGFLINLINFIGLVLLAFCPNKGAQLFGYFANYLLTASWACMSSVVSSNVAGHTKKITANTAFLIGFCAGNMIGPQTFKESEAPIYMMAKRTIVGFSVFPMTVPLVLLAIYYYRNKKKIANMKKNAITSEQNTELSFGDLTDSENPLFRYAL